jgi:hypothetical protein
MELRIEQDYFDLAQYKYKVYDSNGLLFTVKANRTVLPRFRIITIYDDSGKPNFVLKQENLLWFLAEQLPIVSYLIKSSCPFIIYKNGEKRGQIKELFYQDGGTITATIGGLKYQIFAHTGNRFSLFLNDKQIGLISRKAWKQGDADKYTVVCTDELKPVLATIFSVMVDILWHTSDTHFSTVSWEYTIQFGEKNADKD